MPQGFIKLVRQQAYGEGIVDRAFCGSRWSALWKTMADAVVIDVQDERYWYFRCAQQPGKCAEWRVQARYAWCGGRRERRG
jgi:hypothetical protein